jgi:hypothetical protein
VKNQETKGRDANSHDETKHKTYSQLAATHYIRRFETPERFCEVVIVICGLLLGGMSAFGSHRLLTIWTTGVGICAVVFAICFWITDRELERRHNSPSILAQIEALDSLREEGKKLHDAFASPTGNLPDGEPDRWLEKVQLFLRSISRSYAERFDEILKDPGRHTGVGYSPSFTQIEMNQWQNDPRRQRGWLRLTAVLHYLDEVRAELYKNLK